jgi:hypothetical protein
MNTSNEMFIVKQTFLLLYLICNIVQVKAMLQRLQRLSWRRIDVSFEGSLLPLAHNHIQVASVHQVALAGVHAWHGA